MSRNRRGTRAAPPPIVAAISQEAPSTASRIDGIDALRGWAVCLMFVYHFSFDLRFYGVTAANFENDPFWLGFRALIVSMFMGLVGVSLVLADRHGTTPAQFWRRVALIGACAVAVSAGSWIMFPRSFIYFGILHCIAATSLLAWPLVRRPRTALVVGALLIASGVALSHPAFDARGLSFIGYATRKPITEDYVPLAPWAGITFVGIALGHALLRRPWPWLAKVGAGPASVVWLGRHSLLVYMIHQPILLGILWLFVGH